MLRHSEASAIVEYAYNDKAILEQRNMLTEELYGNTFQLYKVSFLEVLTQCVYFFLCVWSLSFNVLYIRCFFNQASPSGVYSYFCPLGLCPCSREQVVTLCFLPQNTVFRSVHFYCF